MPGFEGELRLIVVADPHFIGAAKHKGDVDGREYSLGLELLERIVRRAKVDGTIDAIVLVGDMVDDGNAPGAETDILAMRRVLEKSGLIYVAVPGNHDGPPARFLHRIKDRPGPHTIKGYVLYAFADRVFLDDKAFRNERELDDLIKYVTEHPEQPIVALQHNPIHPAIESDYPYNIVNAQDVVTSYHRAAVVVSVSGHYHPGQPLTYFGGVGYVTAPAICEDPFPYLRINVHGGEVTTTRPTLKMNSHAMLSDVHIHTEYAYCGQGITAETAIKRAETFGVDRIALTEHSDQLYLDFESWLSEAIVDDPDIFKRMKDAGEDRFEEYRSVMEPLRGEHVRLGLEVECNANFEPVLLPEDREGWDVLLGGVHYISEAMIDECGGIEHAFMRLVEALIDSGVDVLAHPFRFFHANNIPTPWRLFRPLAKLLAEEGVAAEVNLHNNMPDNGFFLACLDQDVRIALGSDSHDFHEVGELQLHIDFLHNIGIHDEALPAVLYQL